MTDARAVGTRLTDHAWPARIVAAGSVFREDFVRLQALTTRAGVTTFVVPGWRALWSAELRLRVLAVLRAVAMQCPGAGALQNRGHARVRTGLADKVVSSRFKRGAKDKHETGEPKNPNPSLNVSFHDPRLPESVLHGRMLLDDCGRTAASFEAHFGGGTHALAWADG